MSANSSFTSSYPSVTSSSTEFPSAEHFHIVYSAEEEEKLSAALDNWEVDFDCWLDPTELEHTIGTAPALAPAPASTTVADDLSAEPIGNGENTVGLPTAALQPAVTLQPTGGPVPAVAPNTIDPRLGLLEIGAQLPVQDVQQQPPLFAAPPVTAVMRQFAMAAAAMPVMATTAGPVSQRQPALRRSPPGRCPPLSTAKGNELATMLSLRQAKTAFEAQALHAPQTPQVKRLVREMKRKERNHLRDMDSKMESCTTRNPEAKSIGTRSTGKAARSVSRPGAG